MFTYIGKDCIHCWMKSIFHMYSSLWVCCVFNSHIFAQLPVSEKDALLVDLSVYILSRILRDMCLCYHYVLLINCFPFFLYQDYIKSQESFSFLYLLLVFFILFSPTLSVSFPSESLADNIVKNFFSFLIYRVSLISETYLCFLNHYLGLVYAIFTFFKFILSPVFSCLFLED